MNSSKKVSIIIPCYNAEQYLEQTVNSVLNQTHSSIEVIIVDDASIDQSLSIAKKLSEEYDCIKVFRNNKKGACAARNLGIIKCSGDYIQFLDADDLLSKDKLQKQIEVLETNHNQVAVCNTYLFFNDLSEAYNTDRDFIFTSSKPSYFLAKLWGLHNSMHYVAVHAYLTPRELIQKAGAWNEELDKDQDGEFFARVLLASEGIIYVPQVKCFYRKHLNSSNISSQKKRKHIESNFKATELKASYLLDRDDSAEAQYAAATQYKHVAIEAWPNFKDISHKALGKCSELGGSTYVPVLGGRIIETVKKSFGWKTAKSLSFYLHKLI
ncbi:glycosyltransferase family 2 protein [Carboxylicivirga linearis]|uniref:Glycosyltransferase family 2 protein n=1 Tax=Carboxylicivirga linearis TaxID=1628157 RepID=A0ABS5JUR5_9BACT|nr:glycosyltransferase family 2 protein [Carboxylicivirga linearis]MBS2098540.1 glycosyltransferase family 2 protein [Carboxylicivirga linearis]